MITIRVPCLPPSVNNAFVTVGKRRVLSKDAATFKELVKWTMLAGRETKPRPIDGLLEVSLTFYSQKWMTKAGTPRRIDLDNKAKLFLDAAFEVLHLDDSRIWQLKLRKLEGPEESVMRIMPLEGA